MFVNSSFAVCSCPPFIASVELAATFPSATPVNFTASVPLDNVIASPVKLILLPFSAPWIESILVKFLTNLIRM